ncbi:MAG TPA: hypothetical protein VFP60_08125 [Pseudolabrys sp.]|nr:hypothetical protein [Pseudolabrys sp.]
MPTIEKIWLATLTKNEDDAGTDVGVLNLTIDIDGQDLADIDFGFMNGSGPLSGGLGPDSGWLEQGQAAISGGTNSEPGELLPNPIDASLLTNSSIRLGIRDDDAWAPQQVLVFGQTQPEWSPSQIVALAMETDLTHWLSTDSSEGHLTMPLRLVGPGSATTVIRKVMLLVYTGSGSNVETDSPIRLQITAGGAIVADQTIADTPQDDLEQYTGNWHPVDVAVPFTKGDVVTNGNIRLSILDDDAWLPSQVYVFGLDTESGRPSEVVTLAAIPKWELGSLSTDPSEGNASVLLPVS